MSVLGRDPVSKQIPNGGSITTFNMATTEQWKDKASVEDWEVVEVRADVLQLF